MMRREQSTSKKARRTGEVYVGFAPSPRNGSRKVNSLAEGGKKMLRARMSQLKR
jgi:hypothetical protein